MLNETLQNDMFSCAHLGASEKDSQDIRQFSVKIASGGGLVNYLQNFAFPDEAAGLMRTYLVRDKRSLELAGYFSLKAGLISLNEVETQEGVVFDTLPGVEIANFAVNNGYIQRHPDVKETGFVIFNDFIQPLVEDIAGRIGVKIIYIFALPAETLIHRYIQYGFTRLDQASEAELHRRLKPAYDEGCIFMYQQL